MSTLRHLVLLAGLLCLTVACQRETPDRVADKLNLVHKGAEMPIWIRGNVASGKMVLFLHGGPGDCAMCYQPYFEALEKTVAVAYWDQRVAGSSSGRVHPDLLTYAQFGEDAYYVVTLLKQQYPDVDLYLLAHSFGVELAWQFLTTGDNQRLVKGAMLVNGIFSTYRWLVQMQAWVLEAARAQGHTAAEQFVTEHPLTPETLATYEWGTLYRHMHDLEGNPVSVYEDKKYVLNYLFASPNTALGMFTHAGAYEGWARHEMLRYDKSTALSDITVPIGLFWGEKDGVVPLGVGLETKALLPEDTEVTWVTFENSWHEPFITESSRFVQEVQAFVNRY
ncbi:Pimeloyl-ACP methyl ester carboxylesterase [Catalinimonas alkaloidigena]|uniref:Pimeloyl-ACP methyl ester carboxylesterase n=1 Tax=Catalinimonas alkaloidigena TaxID=1075417 RepID=A0A1G9HEH3_9BACT|nr:alpha/beta fold hydrolase [Catalinimonas alkaloidigena]SDL11255.1 Pimeloyl-ACP methyl ester carboxylesterase [Catalinimonas alkaloidigena]